MLGTTLDALFRQSRDDFEVLVVDSGSTDGTLAIARSRKVRIIEIPPEDFTFGYALNVGDRAARGRYLVHLSAHASPLDDRWLEELLAPLERHSDCAATYGRQVGDPIVNPFEARALEQFYGSEARVQHHDPSFSNANAALRAAVWREIPFDEDVGYAEDQLWARAVQARGLHVRYVPTAPVLHHHDETLGRRARRIRAEQRALLGAGLIEPRRADVRAGARMALGHLRSLLGDLEGVDLTPHRLLQGIRWHLGTWWGRWQAHRTLGATEAP